MVTWVDHIDGRGKVPIDADSSGNVFLKLDRTEDVDEANLALEPVKMSIPEVGIKLPMGKRQRISYVGIDLSAQSLGEPLGHP